MIIILIASLICLPVSFVLGFRLSHISNVKYKQRWLEATALIKQLQTAPLSDGQMKALESEKITKDKAGWKLQVEYCTRGWSECADFSAVNGKQKVPLRSISNWPAWPDSFKSYQKRSEHDIAQMNAAG